MRDSLQLNGNIYQFKQLQDVARTPLTSFEKNTIQFCQDWLTGKPAFELQTSGSTGPPKKMIVDRASMVASAAATAKALSLDTQQTSLVCLDTNYIAGKMMLVRSLEAGMNIIAVEPSANPFEKINLTTKIDFVALVPYQIKAILASPQKEYFNHIKNVIIGGSPVDETTKKELQNFACQFYESYGMTETVSHIALKKVNGKGTTEYFRVLPGISIRQDERACLCITTSYLKEEVITNDVVEMKNLEEFIWLGRIDNVINSGGVKIFPEATEKKIGNVFEEFEMSNRFFVAGLPDQKWGQKVALIIEGYLDEQKKGKVEERLMVKLSKFEIPKVIEFVEKFTETENGKIHRHTTLELILRDRASTR